MVKKISEAFGVSSQDVVRERDLPRDQMFIGFNKISEVEGVTSVAYCGNLMSFVLFVGDSKCYCVKQNTIRTLEGLLGFKKLVGNV